MAAASMRILLVMATVAPLRCSTHLIGQGLGEQLQFAESFAQGAEVEIAQVQGRVVEENSAVNVRHQLYLLCIELKA